MSTGLRAGTNNDGYLQVNGTDVLTALSSGNVGLGISTPTKKLEVAGNEVSFSPDTAGKHTHLFTTNATDDGRYLIKSDTTTVVDIQSNGSSYFNGGSIGIGTNNPQQKLHISGTGNTYTRVDSINGSDTTTLNIGSIASNGASYIEVSNTGSLSSYIDFKINCGGTYMINCLKQGSDRMVSIGDGASNAASFSGLEVQGNFGINGGIIFDSTRRITRTLYPDTDATYDFGAASFRWANIYSADLHLSNEGSTNDVDGTWGKYTIQEGENDLFLLNKRNGKKYKFVLQEVN